MVEWLLYVDIISITSLITPLPTYVILRKIMTLKNSLDQIKPDFNVFLNCSTNSYFYPQMSKNVYGPQMAKDIYGPLMAYNTEASLLRLFKKTQRIKLTIAEKQAN